VLGAYEAEGTFDPDLKATGTDFTSVTLDPSNGGTHFIIGKRLFFDMNLKTDAIVLGSASGNVVIKGMPLPSKSGVEISSVDIKFVQGWATSPSVGLMQQGTSEMFLYYAPTHGADVVQLPVAAVNIGVNSNNARITGSYLID